MNGVAGVRRIPYAGWVALLCTWLGHAYALASVVVERDVYRSWPLSLALWVLSVAMTSGLLAAAMRAGNVMAGRPFVFFVLLVIGVDVGVLAVLEPAGIGGPANWAPGALAVALLGVAAHRSARDVLLLAAAHAVVGVVGGLIAGPTTTTAVVALWLAAGSALLAPLAGATFVRAYADAMRLRDEAEDERLQVEAERRARETAEEVAAARLRSLGQAALPLLDRLVRGDSLPVTQADEAEAAGLARDLRGRLVQGTETSWLTAAVGGDEAGPPLEVADGRRLADRLARVHRQILLVVVAELRELLSDGRLVVTIDEDRGSLRVVAATVGALTRGAKPSHALVEAVTSLRHGTLDAEEGQVVVMGVLPAVPTARDGRFPAPTGR